MGQASPYLFVEENKRRKLEHRQRRMLYIPRVSDDSLDLEDGSDHSNLENRMDRLNNAIEDVRRKLETMGENGKVDKLH